MKTPRELRKERQYTVEFVAEYLGLHKSNYSRKERGLTRFSLEEALKLAKLYGVPVESIDFPAACVAENATPDEEHGDDAEDLEMAAGGAPR